MGQTISREERKSPLQKLRKRGEEHKAKEKQEAKEELHPVPVISAVPRSFQPPWILSSRPFHAYVDIIEYPFKKRWIDEEGKNCFLFASALKITWIEDEQFWRWVPLTDDIAIDADIKVAKLLDVCWLEIHGKFDVIVLYPDITYEVAFVVKREENGYGWDKPVNLKLEIPGGSTQSHTTNINELPAEVWMELKAGEFSTTSVKTGEIEFSLYDYKGGLWKRGLLVLGAIIRPLNFTSNNRSIEFLPITGL